ncbi:sodium:proton exchanger [Candidatus Pacearchaeota archaeon]|nr:sodium:proton exchanger [Candidatus Pacearchaeota archaeon]|tara:strand:+ start:4716 stop:6407 length:1692 start_codon:yes stop_codon:yes gene_type:complete
MAEQILIALSLIIGLAAILTILGRMIKQPPIIAYILTGILAGPLLFGLILPEQASSQMIQTFSHIGVAFLLFIVGLSLDLKVLKEVGAVSTVTGIGGIIITVLAGYFIAIGLGFQSIPALYIAFAISFSSTVVVVKLLSDKREMDTLHARIALGILIIQDFVAALALLILPIMQDANVNTILFQIGKIVGLVILIFLFAKIFVKRLLDYLATNQEVLFLFGIAWALIIASLFDYLGLSLEVGALIAGISIASSKYTLELGGKIKPLRDFFVILFFIFFGSQLTEPITSSVLKSAVIISAFVLIGKPLITMTFMRIFGYKKRTNFLTGSSLAQISEFSLILILLGFGLGHLSKEVMSLAILVALITITISSYGIHHSTGIFNRISFILNPFEGKREEIETKPKFPAEIVLFGYNRTGYSLVNTFKKLGYKFIVVDYNPRVISNLLKRGINAVYGDASDEEFVKELRLARARLVVSTIQDVGSNIVIKDRLSEVNSKALFIATAEHGSEAKRLYQSGIDYVLLPHMLGGEYASKLIEKFKTSPNRYQELKKKQLKEIKIREKEQG